MNLIGLQVYVWACRISRDYGAFRHFFFILAWYIWKNTCISIMYRYSPHHIVGPLLEVGMLWTLLLIHYDWKVIYTYSDKAEEKTKCKWLKNGYHQLIINSICHDELDCRLISKYHNCLNKWQNWIPEYQTDKAHMLTKLS